MAQEMRQLKGSKRSESSCSPGLLFRRYDFKARQEIFNLPMCHPDNLQGLRSGALPRTFLAENHTENVETMRSDGA